MKYFTIGELCQSSHARQKEIDNTPITEAKIALTHLINNTLDPIREKWGKAIRVNSGYRCPVLNKAVGGVATSQHVKGQAADITAGSAAENKKLFEMIAKSKISFDQLIDEKNFSWIHISYNSADNRRQIFNFS